MKTKKIILLLFAVLIMASCYTKEHITAELGKPLHEFNDSSNPLDHKIYEYYTTTGVGILYKYVDRDYNWNINNTINTRLVVKQQENQEFLINGIDYVDMVFGNYYPLEFKKKHFPLYFLLAEETQQDGKKYQFFCGRNYMLFSDINDTCTKLDSQEINKRKGFVNGLYWANYLYSNDIITFPDEFFDVSKDQYEYVFGDATKVDIKKFGFWDGDANFVYYPKQFKGPTKTVDVEQFFTRICSQTKEEIEASMQGYDLLRAKYDILVSYFKRVYNIDIQEIGNKLPK